MHDGEVRDVTAVNYSGMMVVMKKLMTKSNIIFVLILAVFIVKQFPVFKNNFQHENRLITPAKVLSYKDGKEVEFPPRNTTAVSIFWASWCGPCKIEMERLKKSVESGSIPKDKIFAINPFESDSEIQKFLEENKFPFNFVKSSLGKDLNVTVTPTTVFFENGAITSMSSGMSLWGIWKAELTL